MGYKRHSKYRLNTQIHKSPHPFLLLNKPTHLYHCPTHPLAQTLQVDLVNEELESKLCEFLKDCETVSSNLQLQKTQLESFKTYTSEVLEKAKPSDLACNAKDIKIRSTELLGTLVAGLEQKFEVSLQSLDTDLLEDSTYNLLGQIDFKKIELGKGSA